MFSVCSLCDKAGCSDLVCRVFLNSLVDLIELDQIIVLINCWKTIPNELGLHTFTEYEV